MHSRGACHGIADLEGFLQRGVVIVEEAAQAQLQHRQDATPVFESVHIQERPNVAGLPQSEHLTPMLERSDHGD